MGLANKHFYHNSIRKYTVSIGNIFNNIYVVRYDSNGVEIQREHVPISYGPKEKYLYRLEQNPDLNERFAIKLPRMSYELVEVRYDASRHTPANQKIRTPRDVSKEDAQWTYNPLPYEFKYIVYVMGKTTDECLQIIEQIVPFFTPDHTLSIDIIPTLNKKLDVPVTMESVTLEDTWDGSFQDRRNITWQLVFNLKGFLYPPVRDTGVIKQAEWNIIGYDTDEIMAQGIETDPTPYT